MSSPLSEESVKAALATANAVKEWNKRAEEWNKLEENEKKEKKELKKYTAPSPPP